MEIMKSYWKIISALVLLFSFLGGVWAFDDRYAKEVVVAQSLQQFQQQTLKSNKQFQAKIQIQFYQMTYDNLTKEMFSYKRLMRENPRDLEIKEEYDRIVEERKRTKIKINEFLEKMVDIDG